MSLVSFRPRSHTSTTTRSFSRAVQLHQIKIKTTTKKEKKEKKKTSHNRQFIINTMMINDELSLNGILLFGVTILGVEYFRVKRRCVSLVDSYWQERKGRNRVEREMRKISDIQLSSGENGAFFVQPIARVEGCYKQVYL